MDWAASVFLYCERGTDTSLFAEPFNALSNAAFLLAAVVAYRDWLASPARDRATLWLIAGVFTVGIGSTLFHTFANAWSSLADIMPIGAMMLGYLVFVQRRFLRLARPVGLAAVAVFVLAMIGVMRVRCAGGECFNGSIVYFPALAGLVLVGLVLALRRHGAAPWLIGAAALFALSLVFRTLDRALCLATVLAGHAIGTHFLWHSLNGVMLYLLLSAAIRHGAPVPQSSRHDAEAASA